MQLCPNRGGGIRVGEGEESLGEGSGLGKVNGRLGGLHLCHHGEVVICVGCDFLGWLLVPYAFYVSKHNEFIDSLGENFGLSLEFWSLP